MSKDTFNCNLSTLANATELASKVIHSIAGEAISNTIDGKVATNNDVRRAVAAKLQGNFTTHKGGNEQ